MKGKIKVTAMKSGKIITAEVFGDLADRETLFDRLMNRHKVLHGQRNLWKLQSVELIKKID